MSVHAAFDLVRDETIPEIASDVRLYRHKKTGAEVMSYINRLSDFLFVASRYLNDKGARDVLWVPGANR